MAVRRSTIGTNPLHAIIPRATELSAENTAQNPNEEDGASAGRPPAPRPRTSRTPAGRTDRSARAPSQIAMTSQHMEKLTLHVPAELAERAKNAVYWTPGLTLRLLGTSGLERAVNEAERAHGGRFDQRDGELIRGRLGS